MTTRWPKKMPVSEFRKLHYTENGRCQNAVINDIRQGRLPGIKEGSRWYIYVLPDNSPAYGYNEHQPQQEPAPGESVELTGNHLADSILARIAANSGLAVKKAV